MTKIMEELRLCYEAISVAKEGLRMSNDKVMSRKTLLEIDKIIKKINDFKS